MRPTARPVMPGRGRRWLTGVVTAGSALLVAALLLVPVLPVDPVGSTSAATARPGASGTSPSAGSSAAATAKPPTASSEKAAPLDEGPVQVRSLPLLADDGLVRTRFPGGEGLDDPDAVIRALDDAAQQAGLGDVWPSVVGRVPELTTDESRQYPYPYLEYDDLRAAMTPQLVREHERELLELAGLLEVAAARADHYDEGSQWFGFGPDLSWSAVPAYVVLARLAEVAPSCDHQLAVAHVVSLGEAPMPDTLTRVFQDAVDACPGDPTARWLWGQRLVGIASEPDFYTSATRTSITQAVDGPLTFFRRWVGEQPTSVLAHAGLGEALVSAAERMADARRMPFTARAYASQAVEEFRRAEEASGEPAFAIGRGRAMSVLGQAGAADVLRRAVAASKSGDGPTAQWQLQLAVVLEKNRRYSEASRAFLASTRPDDGLRVVAQGLEGRHTWLGAQDAVEVRLSDASLFEAGGATVSWLGFVPDYRDDFVVGPLARDRTCRAEGARRTALLAGLPAPEALPPSDASCLGGDFLSAAEAWTRGDLDTWSSLTQGSGYGFFFDNLQNLWRYGGDLDRADQAMDDWDDYEPGPLADERRGELLVLRKDYDGAVTHLQNAIDSVEGMDWSSYDLSINPYEVLLQLGFAHDKAGDPGAALTSYRRAAEAGDLSADSDLASYEQRNVRASAESQIGLMLLDQDRKKAALPHLRLAARLAHEVEDVDNGGIGVDYLAETSAYGTEPNNLAVLLLDLGGAKNVKEALANARQALPHDPRSPVFLDTLAQAQQRSGRKREAEATYDRAIAEDDTVVQSQNNLGVLASERGRASAATGFFRKAVQEDPTYATAWFNLGVQLEKDWSPLSLLRAQRAFSTATRLDHSLRGVDHVVRADTSAQVSDLDVSRSVSLGWTLAGRSHSPVSGLTLVLLVAAIWQMLLALGLDHLGSKASEGFLRRPWSQRFTPLLRWQHRGFVGLGWALAACTLIAVWPLLGGGVGGGLSTAVVVAAALALLWLFVAAVQAGRPDGATRRGWTPALGLGAVGALVGYAFVPVPVDDTARSSRAQWAGAALLGLVGAVGLGVGYLSGVPLVTAVGVMAWAMFSTAMFPLKPFDGGFLQSRVLRVGVAAVLVAVTGAMALNS